MKKNSMLTLVAFEAPKLKANEYAYRKLGPDFFSTLGCQVVAIRDRLHGCKKTRQARMYQAKKSLELDVC